MRFYVCALLGLLCSSQAAVVPTDPATQAAWAEGSLKVAVSWVAGAGVQVFNNYHFANERDAYYAVNRMNNALTGGLLVTSATFIRVGINRAATTTGKHKARLITQNEWNSVFPPPLRDMTLGDIPDFAFVNVPGKFNDFVAGLATIDQNFAPKWACCLAMLIFGSGMVYLHRERLGQNREFANAARAKRLEILQEIAEHVSQGQHQQADAKSKSLGLMMLSDNGTMRLTHSPFN